MKCARGIMTCVLATALLAVSVPAQVTEDRGGRGTRVRNRATTETAVPPAVAAHQDLSLVLGRPTADSVVLSILSADTRQAYVQHGVEQGSHNQRTERVTAPATLPLEVLICSLRSDTQYSHRLRTLAAGQAAGAQSVRSATAPSV